MASPTKAQPEQPRRLNRRRVSKKAGEFSRKVDELGPDGQELYIHPSHTKYIIATPRSAAPKELRERWHCDVCGYLWSPEGEQRKRFNSIDPSEGFNICNECMFSKWSAWRTQKQRFLSGGLIEFGRVSYFGTVSWNPSEHPPADREAMHRKLDELMQSEELPWVAPRDRCVRFSCASLDVVTREVEPESPHAAGVSPVPLASPRMPAAPTVLESYGLDEVFNLVYLDDAPHHYICVFAGPSPKRATCSVIQVPSPEVALAMCEVYENVVNFVHQQAVLQSVDDHIMAAVEGRKTAAEMQHAEDKRLRRLSWAIRSTAPSESASPAAEEPSSPGGRRGVQGHFVVDYAEDDEADVFGSFGDDNDGADDNAEPTSRLAPRPSLMKGFRPPPAVVVAVGEHEALSGRSGSVRSPDQLQRAIEAYMDQLKANVTDTEMKTFRKLVTAYRKGGEFKAFSTGLAKLFGPKRQHLLPGLRHFVPGQDRAQFEAFLAREARDSTAAAAAGPASVPPPVSQAGLNAYMNQLKLELSGAGEMPKFAELLRHYRQSGQFTPFANGLKGLFGPSRRHLLNGMKHFVPGPDRPQFEAFLKRV